MSNSITTVDYTTQELLLLAHKAIGHWGLEPSTEIRLIKHRENAVFKIFSRQGTYAMRIHRFGYHTDQELLSELHWIHAIPNGELFTADVLPTLNGELFLNLALEVGMQPLQIDLLEWADGAPIATIEDGCDDIELLESTYHQVGRLMAMTHNHAEEWTPPADFERHSWDEQGIFGPNSLWGNYQDLTQLSDEQTQLIDKACRLARKDLQQYGKDSDRYSLIHADFLPENLLKSDKGICLIDFDDAGFGWLLFDIATAVFPYLGEDHFEQVLDAILVGYMEVRPMDDNHLDKLPLFLFIRSVTYLGWMHTRRDSSTAKEMTGMVIEAATALAEQYLSLQPQGSMLGSATTDLNDYDLEDQSLTTLVEQRRASVGGSFLFYKQPLVAQRGEGCYLFDHQDNAYLDCYNNVQSVGHANSAVANAIFEQLNQVNTHSRYLNPTLSHYARQLTSTMPEGLDVVFFTNSGSEANDLAMRIATTISGRSGALVMDAAYHGNTQLIDCLSPATHKLNYRPLAEFVATLPLPKDETAIDQQLTDAINELEDKQHPIAAFMCDSIFDSYGGHIAPENFFAKTYTKVRDNGGYCIADEVQSGFGRTGKMWGFEQYHVVPDMVTLGKPMGNGYPVGAVVTTQEIAAKFMQSTVYFNTFGGNAVSCAAASAVLEQIEQQDLVTNAAKMEHLLSIGLHNLANRFSFITNIRGRGLYFSFDIQSDGEPDHQLASLIPDAMKELGVLVGLTGTEGCSIKIRPPLVFGLNECETLLAAFQKVFSQIHQQVNAA
ncbi:aminotransferase class III-fold pyridoxal phosphate-dependent enzyme [Vibrio sp. SCSIO 43136]|uniref:aminotransferase class III-fold pyridoxal phosphate-dependent enzyme n=1 Tax=Vibrio sp. SCSIO 43136 TaxID=2819101 RepID=UPI0020756523|nr:aminotransferase class III-fold pyridoxal phosphate-dependent enzyme [Vibrio sp. SCSIO 43136]USD67300.1 aminotransferase class III-fold pyridoxal phosphate-dependent enzyme [Vibrio sp. SCSIO 43136]